MKGSVLESTTIRISGIDYCKVAASCARWDQDTSRKHIKSCCVCKRRESMSAALASAVQPLPHAEASLMHGQAAAAIVFGDPLAAELQPYFHHISDDAGCEDALADEVASLVGLLNPILPAAHLLPIDWIRRRIVQ